jgi:D-serine deaminase-like pyridoxal phosphate-dependent protein
MSGRRHDLDTHVLDAATADLDPPLAVVDLDAFDANRTDLARRAAGTPIRVASKSVRCRALIEHALKHPGFRGVMAYSVAEAVWLRSRRRRRARGIPERRPVRPP